MIAFDGQVCVVTGATSGIGRALTVALGQKGALVWALGRSRQRLDAIVEELKGLTGTVTPVVADLERDADVKSAAKVILSEHGRVDVLIHSAGAIALGSFQSVSGVDFDRQFRVNLRAPVFLTQALLPALKEAEGQIVFINSSAAIKANADNALYAATKHGLKAIADGLRDEVNPHRVRVISVYTGRTASRMQIAVHEHEARPYRPELLLRPEDVVDVVLAALSVPPSGEVTDVSVRPIAKLPPS